VALEEVAAACADTGTAEVTLRLPRSKLGPPLFKLVRPDRFEAGA